MVGTSVTRQANSSDHQADASPDSSHPPTGPRLAPGALVAATVRGATGRLVVAAPDVVAAWGGHDVTGDGSAVRRRMHRGRTRLGLIVVAHTTVGGAALTTGTKSGSSGRAAP